MDNQVGRRRRHPFRVIYNVTQTGIVIAQSACHRSSPASLQTRLASSPCWVSVSCPLPV